ncbi:hypothetical protein [Burkholderia cepacia]|uniref:hypothetical protein n=1 Tax=Burkholderia cepacia TaxID=292 RepID=UPI001CF52449|nr:hypothetical protein [Burkholderia cepacia]MCA8082056.1 hypothetical protein [Burkholderia cepacia]
MAMTVRELLALLQNADPDSRVLFLTEYAGIDEADEVCEVFIPKSAWTHERGRYGSDKYDVRYPGAPAARDDGYSDVTYSLENVVVLSPGSTNLRFSGDR